MFESAELGHKVKKSVYEKEVPALRAALLEAQFELAQSARFAVIILIGGVDGAGRGATVNLLNEWMDPRHIQTHGMGEPSDEELERPLMWRFWRVLPPQGQDRHLSRHLVHLAHPRPGERRHQDGRPGPEPGAGQQFETDADRRGRPDPQVLDAPVQGEAEEAAQEAWRRTRRPAGGSPSGTGSSSSTTTRSRRCTSGPSATPAPPRRPGSMVEGADATLPQLTVGKVILEGPARPAGPGSGAAAGRWPRPAACRRWTTCIC